MKPESLFLIKKRVLLSHVEPKSCLSLMCLLSIVRQRLIIWVNIHNFDMVFTNIIVVVFAAMQHHVARSHCM